MAKHAVRLTFPDAQSWATFIEAHRSITGGQQPADKAEAECHALTVAALAREHLDGMRKEVKP